MMRKFTLFGWSVLVCLAFLFGCAPLTVQSPFQAKNLDTSGAFVQKADSFLVILDASQSMRERYQGEMKLLTAKEVLVGMNQTIPDLTLNAGLRLFGDTPCPVIEKTELVYGMAPYTEAAFEEILQQAGSPGGNSPLAEAIEAASGDLQSEKGNIAVIIVSDGADMDEGPIAAAQNLKNAFGERICLYTIFIGNDPEGKALLDKISNTGGCGYSVDAQAVSTADGMADFVTKVFLQTDGDSDGDGVPNSKDRCPNTPRGAPVDRNGCPLDSDGDGVYDYKDKCPGTPKGVAVDSNGCPLDSDGDGVLDHKDQCPGTPKGAKVNEVGCWVLVTPSLDTGEVLFATNKSDLKPAAIKALNEVVNILNGSPDLKVEIQGHTDNVGSAAYNKSLSERRAQSAMQYLIDQGISPDRLSAVGYGLHAPVATNATAEGRAKNRRVELKPMP